MAETLVQPNSRRDDSMTQPRSSLGAERRTQNLATVMPAAVVSTVSGLYTWKLAGGIPFDRAELRLDVDGTFPLQVASGSERAGLTQRVDWIAQSLTADVQPSGTVWTGSISYTNGDTHLLAHTTVRIERNGTFMRLTLSGGGPALVRDYKLSSPSFHLVEFEYDSVEGVTPVTSIHTHDHPNRPGTLPAEDLSIETVFRRAGFDVSLSGNDSVVPLSLAGANEEWSDSEMHDAMQAHWSRFANKPQWSLWTLFAALHEQGDSLGGVMFDDIGSQHRQGTALFLKSFIADAPSGDAAPDAWVRRMAFWTAVHEMGHAFNLAHAWQKSLSFGGMGPWIPLSDDDEARSFMNYPFRVSGGQAAFFRDFEFRFGDEEMLFLRHAPERFVQMGNARWFDNHGFEQANVSPSPQLQLTLRVNRDSTAFEFLEPVVIELKLTNISGEPTLVPDKVLQAGEQLTLIVKRNNEPARLWRPYAHYCWRSKNAILAKGESMYESLFLSAGHEGWLLAEPGRYQIQACLHLNGEDVVSAPFSLRIAPPRNYDEQYLAQDFFSDEVGRVLAFDGSRFLGSANDTLHEVAQRFPNSRAAVHARVAVGMPATRAFKSYEPPSQDRRGDRRTQGRISVHSPEPDALQALAAALGADPDGAKKAAEALGHIDYRYYAEHYCDALEQQGDKRDAQEARQLLYETLVDRRILKRVLAEIRSKLDVPEEEDRRSSRPSRRR